MTVLPLVLWPDERLQRGSDAVEQLSTDIATLVRDMFETMYAAPGRGLAAPQVGVMQRVFVMDATWKDGDPTPVACINPEIRIVDQAVCCNEEACLSIPGVSAKINRPKRIALEYTDVEGVRCSVELEGFAAVCAQHEMDHLEGRVIFDHLEPRARAELEDTYREMNA